VLIVCNTYRFSTATMVTHTLLNITLYVRCLSCGMLDAGIVTTSTTCLGEIWGSYSSVVENSVLLGYDAVSVRQ